MKINNQIKKGADPIIIIGIGSIISFVSIFLPYLNLIFGFVSINGTYVPVGALLISLTSVIGLLAIYKYNIAETKKDLINSRLMGFISTFVGGISIFIYYISFDSSATRFLNENIENPLVGEYLLPSYLSFGIGFYGFIVGTGFIFLGSFLISTYINYKPRMNIPMTVDSQSYTESSQYLKAYKENMDNKSEIGIKENLLKTEQRRKRNFCSNCGEIITPITKFCSNCGSQLD